MNNAIVTAISFPSNPVGEDKTNIISACSEIESWDLLNFFSIEKWSLSDIQNQGPIAIMPYFLRHRLSDEMMGERASSLRTRHSPFQEIKVSMSVKDSFYTASQFGTVSFFNLLKVIHLEICPLSPSNFRSSAVVSGKSPFLSDYGYIEFIKHSNIIESLNEVWEYWVKCSSSTKIEIKLQSAIVLYCNILSIHPFSDGNGRVSRVILNCALSYIFKKDIFFPESSLSLISEAGFLLCKREAQVLKNWIPLIRLFCSSIRQLTHLRSFVWMKFTPKDISFRKILYNDVCWRIRYFKYNT